MNYIEIKCRVQPVESGSEILTALLGDMGCDSFMDWEEGLLAYIPEADFSEEALRGIQLPETAGITWSYSLQRIQDKDWNAEWESHYEPVWVDGICHIRAPFHLPAKEAAYDLLIEPKMSFGTAHHETTAQMISYLLEEDCQGKSVLDMGSGTGVLAILAAMRGASELTAIDNDEWAYRNMLENCRLNHTENILCIWGDAHSIPDTAFDVVLANINRNILLQDMAEYVKHLKANGTLLISGFYEGEDLVLLRGKAEGLGLAFASHRTRNRWVAARFTNGKH
ncbi:MAG: 50S ribosomal protein L11 methyltransferase [Bacteroidales bacterium]|nr:50S ribosomal protein L11 methyltransferase [Bacteroidales bacterium]